MSRHPISLQCLDHVVLRVRDVEAMIAFYCDVVGCEVVRRRPDIGLYHLAAGRAMIDLVPVDGQLGAKGGAAPGVEGRNMDHFCLQVSPFDEAAISAHLAARGIAHEATATRFGAQGDGPSLYVQDPEGNTVELKGPPDA